MPRRRKAVAPRTEIAVLVQEVEKLRKEVAAYKQAGPSAIHLDDFEAVLEPIPGQIMVNHPGSHTPATPADPVVYYHPGDESVGGTTPAGFKKVGGGPPIYVIKVFSELQVVLTGLGRFRFAIDEDVDGMSLSKVEMYVTTVSSSGIVQVQVKNMMPFVDMLSTAIQVDANEKHSKDAAISYVINPANAVVAHGDEISIDVWQAGNNARGLGISLTFS